MRKPAPEFEAFLKKIADEECCTIRVKSGPTVKGTLQDYKIYINRNVRSTPPRFNDRRTATEEFIPVKPGEYLVVVRERG